jgi:class 3 adenylate cyclase
VALVLGVSGALIIRDSVSRVTAELGSKLSSIAATAALSIDAEQHAALAASGKKGDEAYNRIKALLVRVKKVNDQQGIYDIYTMVRTEKPNIWQFIVDVDESDTAAGFREEFDISPYPVMKKAFNGPAADKKITRDRWGYWLTAYAPVRDRNGIAVAIVGIDASAAGINELKKKVMLNVLLLIIVGIIVSFPLSWFAGRIIENPIQDLVKATREIGKGNLDYRIAEPGVREFEILADSFNAMMAGLKERNYIKNTFSRYVSKEVAERIMNAPGEEIIKGERRSVTVLFTDLRRFTAIAETMKAEEVLDTLNEHFSLLIDVLFEYDGTLDKFTGDGLMALFGAPVMHPNDPERAVRAALRMQEKMAEFNAARSKKGLMPFEVGIGINSGTAVAGNIGSSRRMEYTVIGNTVNSAARIQGLAEGGQVLITQSTYDHVKDIVRVIPKGPVELKGKKEAVNIYLVEGTR